MNGLRKIEAALVELADRAEREGEPINPDDIRLQALRVGAQAEMVEHDVDLT